MLTAKNPPAPFPASTIIWNPSSGFSGSRKNKINEHKLIFWGSAYAKVVNVVMSWKKGIRYQVKDKNEVYIIIMGSLRGTWVDKKPTIYNSSNCKNIQTHTHVSCCFTNSFNQTGSINGHVVNPFNWFWSHVSRTPICEASVYVSGSLQYVFDIRFPSPPSLVMNLNPLRL